MATTKRDIRYLNKDFGQFRNNLIEFTKTYFPNTYNDFNESSPGMLFIEMASYVGDVLSYYTDHQLKESFIHLAGDKANVQALAANLGYKTKNRIPSVVDIDVFQLLPAKTVSGSKQPDWAYALTIDEGMTVKPVNNDVEFRTTQLVNFSVSSSFDPTEISVYQINENNNTPELYLLKKKVPAVAGVVIRQDFTFTTPKRYDKIVIPREDCIGVIKVVDSDGNEWSEVPYLAQEMVYETVSNVSQNDPELSQFTDVPYLLKMKRTARRFVTRFRSNKFLELQFGAGVSSFDDEEIIPNPELVGSSLIGSYNQIETVLDPSNFMYTKTYGLAPANTTLTVTYTVGGGIESNVAANTLTEITGISFTVDPSGLDEVLLAEVQASVATNNPLPAAGGKSEETLEEIRENAMAFFGAQSRSVTTEDYIIRAYALPQRFGSVAKAYAIQDNQIDIEDATETRNPLAVNLHVLGYDSNGSLSPLNKAVKTNLKTYMQGFRLLSDAINIKDAFVINIGIQFDIITLPEFNANEVLLECISKLKTLFDIKKWSINQPIVLSKIYTELDRVNGVQSVPRVVITNLFDPALGYSGVRYDITEATLSGVIYPSLDPSIFEVKFPNNDITGRVGSL